MIMMRWDLGAHQGSGFRVARGLAFPAFNEIKSQWRAGLVSVASGRPCEHPESSFQHAFVGKPSDS